MFKIVPEVLKPLLIFKKILVSSFCSSWMFISSFCSKSLIWVQVSFPSLLVPCIFSLFHFAYYSFLCFTQPSFFPLFHDHTQPFLWAPRLPVFWTLHLISWLSLHRLVLFLEFWSILSFGLYLFVSAQLLHCKGEQGALGIYQGGAAHFAACGAVCRGGVWEGTILLAWL